MKHVILPSLILAIALTGCATPDRAGVRNPEFFRKVATQTSLESPLAAKVVAACFEEKADLLPMSKFTRDEASGRTTYRLRGFGFTFEEIDFEDTVSGSRMTIFIAPNVDSKWRKDFERDRGNPLKACATIEN
ncbi:hypothetical protein [Asticcacaulis sp. AC402]|uniref:hypothetical protein n=1 Tax=Asticcacaulis sp. AC402 TaxID=1282361 RepID=UPI0003C3C00F|nr:hypothetical protein [Asticcacaulis sp. AC402]ESQ73994.1 hypothetical protein ABAC402_16645 [Asticcacaulis sp. AC402]